VNQGITRIFQNPAMRFAQQESWAVQSAMKPTENLSGQCAIAQMTIGIFQRRWHRQIGADGNSDAGILPRYML